MKRQWHLMLWISKDLHENYVFDFRSRESELAIALDAVRAPICRPGIEAAPDDEWVRDWLAYGG